MSGRVRLGSWSFSWVQLYIVITIGFERMGYENGSKKIAVYI